MPKHLDLGISDMLRIYEKAHLAVCHDALVKKNITAGKLRMSFHSARGQEIIPASICTQLTDRDYYVTIYRGSHDLVCKGVPLRLLWAEYAGRSTGACKGKGGPMHVTYPEAGVMVTTGIVGSGLPIANGLGLASQMLEDGRVTVCNFGDGASNIGAFHEALNLASLWKLPVVFICQNNRYAEHTSYAAGTAIERISDRSTSYSMAGVTVNGNDPEAMWSAAHEAIERARSGDGPTLIEALTFRFTGHSFGDDSHYIPKDELEEAIRMDPVPALRKTLLGRGCSESQIVELEQRNLGMLEDALDFAFNSPYPEVAELFHDVFGTEIAA